MLTSAQALEKYFGLNEFRPCQQEIIDSVLAGQNTLATLPTGSGKSLTFQLPALILPGSTLIISPLLSLIRDQVQKLQQQGISACQIDSTLSPLASSPLMKYIATPNGDIVSDHLISLCPSSPVG